MCARIVLTTFALLGLLPFAGTAAAQTSLIPSSSPQQYPEKMQPAAKLLPLPPATQIVLLPDQSGPTKNPTFKLQELKTLIERLQNRIDGLPIVIMRSNGGPDAPNCAHIQIFQAPEMDSEMVLEAPPGAGGDITTFQGLPPCRRDLPAPMTAQRFYGVPPKLPALRRAPFVQPSASQIPSAQPQSVEPKPDGTVPKP